MHPDSFDTDTDLWDDNTRRFTATAKCENWHNARDKKFHDNIEIFQEIIKNSEPAKPFVPKSKKFATVAAS